MYLIFPPGALTNERPGKGSNDRCWPMKGLKIKFTGKGEHTDNIKTNAHCKY